MPFPTFTIPLFRKYNRLNSSDDPEQSIEKETFYLHHEDQNQAIISAPTSTPISQLKNMYIKVSSIRLARIEGNATPWIFLTFVFALLSTVLLFNGGNRNGGRWTGETERERTDRILGIPKIPILPVQFSGSPSFDSNGVESMVPESPPYTGYPSPEIDEAWEVLNGGRYFAITEKEAKELWGKGYMEFADKIHGGFTTGLDVFHSLHCLNSIRVALYPDSYPPPDHTHGPEHLDHCLIHLRQHIQCSGDTTPNPTKFYPGINSNYVYGDRTHSCRDWSVIRKWAWERHNGTLKVEREGLKKL